MQNKLKRNPFKGVIRKKLKNVKAFESFSIEESESPAIGNLVRQHAQDVAVVDYLLRSKMLDANLNDRDGKDLTADRLNALAGEVQTEFGGSWTGLKVRAAIGSVIEIFGGWRWPAEKA